MTQEELTQLIEQTYIHAAPGEFKDIKSALVVLGSALRYLTNQCEDMQTREVPDDARPESPSTD